MNVVLSNADWSFVDFEWCGPMHDWRMMFAHLIGWLPPLMTDAPRIDVTIRGRALRMLDTLPWTPSPADVSAIARYLALLWFRESQVAALTWSDARWDVQRQTLSRLTSINSGNTAERVRRLTDTLREVAHAALDISVARTQSH